MTTPYLRSTPTGLAPEPIARSPWSAEMLHGRLIGGAAARALETDFGAARWRAGRLTVDLFRPAAMSELTIETRAVREGRRIRVADALVTCGGHLVARATVLFLAEGREPPGNIWRPDAESWPTPDSLPDHGYEVGAFPAWRIKGVDGGFASAERGRVWTNETAPLVDDEEMSPFVRAAVSADLACPMANGSDEGLHYINGDYTLALGRYPVGTWVGLRVSNQIAAGGISIGSCVLVDRNGPFATSTGSSLATAPLDEPG